MRLRRLVETTHVTLRKRGAHIGAMIGAGRTLRTLGRYDQPIRTAQQILARSKNDPEALYRLDASHVARGDDAAEKLLTRLRRRFSPSTPSVLRAAAAFIASSMALRSLRESRAIASVR